MRLARMANGQVGRVLRSMGEQAVIENPSKADYSSSTDLDLSTLDQDQNYWRNVEAQNKAQIMANQELNRARNEALKAQFNETQESIKASQKIPLDPTQEKIKNYLIKQKNQTESERTVLRLKPDFYDRESIPVGFEQGMSLRSGDYRQNDIMGNPLTRDGQYGPVTDYDRFVEGGELDNDIVQVVGGTMLRRLPPRPQMGRKSSKKMSGMGDFWSDLLTNTTAQLTEQVPEALVANLVGQLNPPPPPTNTVTTIIRAPAIAVNSAARKLGVPPWVIYSAFGVLAGSLVLVLVKSKKS